MYVLVKGGTVVTAADTYAADILIQGPTISRIEKDLNYPADQVIDASGKLVFPGGVDVHVHNDEVFGGTHSADDFYSGTVAAACGGTTTVVDFAYQSKGGSLAAALGEWQAKGEGKAAIDYGLHMIIVDVSDEILAEIPAMVEEGVTSFKMFMAYKNDLMVSDGDLFRVLQKCRQAGAVVSVHAENGDLLDVLVKGHLSRGETAPKYHAASRPPAVEAEATGRAITIARLADAPLYIVHLSCAEALSEVCHARAAGQPVFAETCPQYLCLDSRVYDAPGFEAAKFVCSPPIRDKRHQEALWSGLRSGNLQTVGSDHSSFNFQGQKELGREDFSKIPNGIPGAETRLYLLYTYGVLSGRISLNRFVDIACTAPAKLFGLFPKKGTIAVGSDADMVIWDPKKEFTIAQRDLHNNMDYTPFEGMRVRGAPSTVLSKGEVIFRNGSFCGRVGTGEFLKRGRSSESLNTAPPASTP